MTFESSPAQPPQGPAPLSPQEFKATAEGILTNVEWVIEGKSHTIKLALAVMLAEGHLLLEDVPGVGKTQLAKALARSVDCSVRRIQFTPDLLPSDVTGVSIFDPEKRDFVFKPGAIFGNLILGDEINRASPKTQAALLECMEERQVTVDGNTYKLRSPFMVIATQNPVEMEGTYPLPEAQRDRFAARLAIGYPDINAELALLDRREEYNPLDALRPVADAEMIVRMIAAARAVHLAPELEALRRRPGGRDAHERAGPPRGEPARHPAAAAVHAGARGDGRPRFRAAGRRAAAGRAGARAPAHPHHRDDDGRGRHEGDRLRHPQARARGLPSGEVLGMARHGSFRDAVFRPGRF